MSRKGAEVTATIASTCNPLSKKSGPRGFTLIELMITLAVLTVTLTLAAPSFTELIRDNRLISEVYAMRATLNMARSEAIARRLPVVVCGTVDGLACSEDPDWSSGYMVLLGADDSATVDVDNPSLNRLQWENRPNSRVSMVFSGDFTRFDAMGASLGNTGTLVFCDARGAEKARGLIVTSVGSLRASVDDDDNGVVEDASGNDVSC